MTNDEIRIEIAESQGDMCQHCQLEIGIGKSHPRGWCDCENPRFPKDYANDLNAMHEVEKTLTQEQEVLYVECLAELIYEDGPRYLKSSLSSGDSTYRATARQRAEAYLRTKGLWKE